MRSVLRLLAATCLLPSLLLTVSGCGNSAGYPPLAEIKALTEPKPVPGDDIVTDPVASARHGVAVEGWGDRLWSAGGRLCRFYERIGMKGLDCP